MCYSQHPAPSFNLEIKLRNVNSSGPLVEAQICALPGILPVNWSSLAPCRGAAVSHCSTAEVHSAHPGTRYQEACMCSPRSPVPAFSVNTGDILVFRLPYSLSYISAGSKLTGSGKRNAGCWALQTPKGLVLYTCSLHPAQPWRFVASFSPSQETLCAPVCLLRTGTGQALASL